MAVATFTAAGSKASTPAKLSNDIFGVEVNNHQLLKQAYESYLANGRDNLARTKKRGEVSGGGKKPWKQKGTGRARFGSSRNPIWRGGGIVFGPTGNENYSMKLSTTAKRVALRQALSLAAQEGAVNVIENLVVKDAKTAAFAALMTKLSLTRGLLVVVADKTDELIRATRNLPEVNLVSAKYLNVYDILNAHAVLMTADALKIVESWLGKESK